MPKNKTSPQKLKKKSNIAEASNKQQQQQLSKSEEDYQPHRSSSSCETLEAGEGITSNALASDASISPLCKPLPPLPNGKISHASSSSNCSSNSSNNHTSTTTPANNSAKNSLKSLDKMGNNHHAKQNHASHEPCSKVNNHHTNSHNNSQNNHQNGLHHAQPYHPSAPGTPTLMCKRDYQHPPPVPPHQNNNHHQLNNMIPPHYNHHAAAAVAAAHHQMHSGYQAPPPPMTPSMEQQRRTLDRSNRNLHYPMADNVDNSRMPSLRRTRRTSGNAANNNGGVGIPIVPGSPRVQRSPMPARTAMMKRNRLGSHNDNISSGSLNSIEV